jgi:hypothetical protein
VNPKVFGWHYPAGVTEKTIDEHFGDKQHPICKMCDKNEADETLDGEAICQRCLANVE